MARLNPFLKQKSRALRSQMTIAEQHLWRYLRMRQVYGQKFRRQHPCNSYILDFACLEIKLIIELDGGQHGLQQTRDNERTRILMDEGWTVLRFWNDEVLKNTADVLSAIGVACKELLPPS